MTESSHHREKAHESLAVAYIALGSNLGNKEKHLRRAITALGWAGTVGPVSGLYATEPEGPIPQPIFFNAVLKLQTSLPPDELLAELQRIERDHGRDRAAGPPKGPRTLDLDLLSYDSLVLDTPQLTLPHPALAERRFVLVPLAEIAPKWRHPVTGKSAVRLLRELPAEGPYVLRLPGWRE